MPKRSDVPTPQLIHGVESAPKPKQRTDEPIALRQQRIDEFLMARSLAPKSQKAYREDLARFTSWTETAWGQITPRMVAQYKAHLLRVDPKTQKRALADASVLRILQTLKNFLGWMARSGYIDRDPTTEISLRDVPDSESEITERASRFIGRCL
jgi:integrase/recombinase XerD